MNPLALSAASTDLAGVLLCTVVAVEYGGWFVLRVTRGAVPATETQRTYFRAGHAHAGILVTLALVGTLYVDAAGLTGWAHFGATNGIWAAAILMPAGFFLSVTGRDVTEPNRLIGMVYAGAACLAAGVLCLGIGLITA